MKQYCPIFLTIILLITQPLPTSCQDFNFEYKIKTQAKILVKSYADSVKKYKASTGKAIQQLYKASRGLTKNNGIITGIDPTALLDKLADKERANAIARAGQLYRANLKMLERWYTAYLIIKDMGGKEALAESWAIYKEDFEKFKTASNWYDKVIQQELMRKWLFFHHQKYDFGGEIYSASKFGAEVNFGYQLYRDPEYDDIKLPSSNVQPTSTISAGGKIDPAKILYSYPLNGQFNFYPQEFNRYYGFIKFNTFISELQFSSEYPLLWAKWKNIDGEVVYTEVSYQPQQAALFFNIPISFLTKNTVYEFSIVKIDQKEYKTLYGFYGTKEISDLIRDDVWHLEVPGRKVKEEGFFLAYFRTSRHYKFLSKLPYQQFVQEKEDVYTLTLDEPLGPEETKGLHGLPPLAKLEFDPGRHIRDNLTKLYSTGYKFFYAHLTDEFIDKLHKDMELRPKLDSLVDREFISFSRRGQRIKNMALGRFRQHKGYRVGDREILPPYVEEETTYEFIEAASPITEQDFNEKKVFDLKQGRIRSIYNLTSFAQNLLPKVQSDIRARKTEYIKLLEKIDTLEGRKNRYNKGTYAEALDAILPKEINQMLGIKELAIPADANVQMQGNYTLPNGSKVAYTRISTSN